MYGMSRANGQRKSLGLSLLKSQALSLSIYRAKLAPIENRVKRIQVDLLENNALPRLNTIES